MLTNEDYELLAAFRYSLRMFLRFSEEAAQAAGLTPHQHQALLAIKGFPGREQTTIGELAERLQSYHHSVVGLVDRLVAQGLAARRQATDDRRCVYVRLTERGEAVLAELSLAHRNELRRIGPQIGALLQRLAESGDGSNSQEKPARRRPAAGKAEGPRS